MRRSYCITDARPACVMRAVTGRVEPSVAGTTRVAYFYSCNDSFPWTSIAARNRFDKHVLARRGLRGGLYLGAIRCRFRISPRPRYLADASISLGLDPHFHGLGRRAMLCNEPGLIQRRQGPRKLGCGCD